MPRGGAPVICATRRIEEEEHCLAHLKPEGSQTLGNSQTKRSQGGIGNYWGGDTSVLIHILASVNVDWELLSLQRVPIPKMDGLKAISLSMDRPQPCPAPCESAVAPPSECP